MKIISSILLVLFFFTLAISSSFSQPARDISQANNKFAFDLYSRFNVQQGNIFFSPYSLSSALTMTYEGARHETANEMREVLYLPSDEVDWRVDVSSFIQSINKPHKAYELSLANTLWAQKSYLFKEEYLNLVKNTYFAQARNLDFAADPDGSRITINKWVSDNTKDHINDLLPVRSITKDTRLVLTNAVYFKEKWSIPFDKGMTKQDVFWISSGAVQIAMMGLIGKSFNYIENDQAQVLELPYRGEKLSMLIILPRSKEIQGLEKSLTLDIFNQWQRGMTLQGVNFFLPKFKFDWQMEMSNILSGMGMKLAFDENNADFSGMADKKLGENLYIGAVFHRAWIETNEEGTEAAAATSVVGMRPTFVRILPEPKIFRADHPFIFVIRDNKTGHILFMGRVSDPRENEKY